jgi:hypothetical protein
MIVISIVSTKNIITMYDTSRIVIDSSRVTIQIVASLTNVPRGIDNDHDMFIAKLIHVYKTFY